MVLALALCVCKTMIASTNHIICERTMHSAENVCEVCIGLCTTRATRTTRLLKRSLSSVQQTRQGSKCPPAPCLSDASPTHHVKLQFHQRASHLHGLKSYSCCIMAPLRFGYWNPFNFLDPFALHKSHQPSHRRHNASKSHK